MFNRKIQQNNKQDLTLFKGRNDYNKVVKQMNEPPKDYEHIKLLVEDASADASRSIRDKKNTITNLENNINIKSKNNIQIKSHKKLSKWKYISYG